jgi:formylglycine-generating enzyme required for sulfatase activity
MVGSYDNASWVGAYDMSGNVWEWVSSLYDEYPYVSTDGRENLTTTAGRRVARGGAFDYYQAGARTTARVRNPPERQLDNAGFRCVRSQ